jgi:potassium-transporting ATPase KdpC subunit
MKTIIISLKALLFFTVLTGVAYPLLITGIAQAKFPSKANGSIIIMNNKAVGSALIGQNFDTTIYFSSRPSAISYVPIPSGASNLALTNSKLKNMVDERRLKFIAINNLDSLANVPSEMLFSSASGLDPHISPKAAIMQIDRIVKIRHFNGSQKDQLISIIKNLTEAPQFLCLGERRINVLKLNIKLDEIENIKANNK